jgi:hypothetical protein
VQLLTTWINGELDERQTYADWRMVNFEPDNDPSGAPEVDADGDGVANQEEYLAGTNPNSGGSFPQPLLSKSGETLTLSFNVPVNRSYRIETSGNLSQWTPWDVPGNQGLPTAGGLIEITHPVVDPLRFFRVELNEN